MNNNKQNIDHLFKQKLENFELSSEGASWKMLQLVKERNLRLEKVLFTKMIVEMVILISAAIFLVVSSSSPVSNSVIKPLYTQDDSDGINKLTIEEYISSKELISNPQFSTSQFNNSKINSLVPTKGDKFAQYSKENDFELNSDTRLYTKNEMLIIASEAITTYKKWSKNSKEAIQKTSENGINTSYDEYAPVINNDGSYMFFTSRRPITNKEIRIGKGRERIYYTETTATGWTEAQLLNSPINSEKNYNSAVALSKDGKSLFIYRDDRFGNGDLYESKLKNSKWSTPEALPYPINSEFHESTLSLTSDGNIIYFTSNRDGGFGGMDIWYSEKNKAGIWKEAKNLGSEINTEHDEEGVFIHPDGKTLYFSSRGHKGMGGYDIYYTTLEKGKWSKPVNLGPEINTKNDDVYFVLGENGTDAYYTSVDPKTPEKKDIFKIKYNQDLLQKMNNKSNSSFALLEGTVLSKNNKTPIEAKIEVFKVGTQELITSSKSNTKTGEFSIPLSLDQNYRIRIYKEGYLYYTEEVITHSSDKNQVINKEVLLDPLQINTQFVLKELSTSQAGNSIDQNVQTSLDELHLLMTSNPKLKVRLSIEINSDKKVHTMNNQKFIERCVDYLKLKGINKDRLVGETLVNTSYQESINQSSTLNVTIIEN